MRHVSGRLLRGRARAFGVDVVRIPQTLQMRNPSMPAVLRGCCGEGTGLCGVSESFREGSRWLRGTSPAGWDLLG